VFRFLIDSRKPNEDEFCAVMQGVYAEMTSDLVKQGLVPCVIVNLTTRIKAKDSSVDVLLQA
jgi:hypothetical protein